MDNDGGGGGGGGGERDSRCLLVWVNNAADFAVIVWAGCHLAATIRRHGDGAQTVKYCGGNVGELEPDDLPGWLVFWIDGDGHDELNALRNQLGYQSAGVVRCDQIGDVVAGDPPCRPVARRIRDASTAEEVLCAMAPGMAVRAVAPETEEVRDDGGWPAAREGSVDAATAGCRAMSCVTFTTEMCCGNCSIM